MKNFAERVKDLAAIIMDADLPKRLQRDNDVLRAAVPPRWIRDEKTNELFERQPDNSYRAAYHLTPIN